MLLLRKVTIKWSVISRIVIVTIIYLLATGQAQQADPSQRIKFEGFSVQLPDGKPWFRYQTPWPNVAAFGRQVSATHTFQVMVRWESFDPREFFQGEPPGASAEPSQRIEWTVKGVVLKGRFMEQWIAKRKQELSSGRYQAKSFEDTAPSDEPFCRWYHAVAHDTGAPGYTGTALPFEMLGKVCFDPDPKSALFVDVNYSERRLPEEAGLTSFKSESEGFIGSLVFSSTSK